MTISMVEGFLILDVLQRGHLISVKKVTNRVKSSFAHGVDTSWQIQQDFIIYFASIVS